MTFQCTLPSTNPNNNVLFQTPKTNTVSKLASSCCAGRCSSSKMIVGCFIKYKMSLDSSFFHNSCIVSEAGTALWSAPGVAAVRGQAAFDSYCAELE